MKKDPSKKSMTKFYVGAAGVVLTAMICVVLVGRFGHQDGSHLVVTQEKATQPVVSEVVTPEPEPVVTPEPEPEPTPESEPTPIPGTEVLPEITVPNTGVLVYRITWGDTLTYLQNLTGFTIQELADFNDVEDPNLIITKHFLVMPQGVARDIIVDDASDIPVVLSGGEAASELSAPEDYAELALYVDMEEYRQRLADLLAEQEAADAVGSEIVDELEQIDVEEVSEEVVPDGSSQE